jgi:hypothetical protein
LPFVKRQQSALTTPGEAWKYLSARLSKNYLFGMGELDEISRKIQRFI